MLWKLATQLVAAGHREVSEIEPRRDGAADQCVRARIVDGCAEQTAGYHNGLRQFTSRQITADLNRSVIPDRIDHVQGQARPVVEVEDFVLLDSMQSGKL